MEKIIDFIWLSLTILLVAGVILGFVFGGFFLSQGSPFLGYLLLVISGAITLAFLLAFFTLLRSASDLLNLFFRH